MNSRRVNTGEITQGTGGFNQTLTQKVKSSKTTWETNLQHKTRSQFSTFKFRLIQVIARCPKIIRNMISNQYLPWMALAWPPVKLWEMTRICPSTCTYHGLHPFICVVSLKSQIDSQSDAKLLVCAFLTYKLKYCNFLLSAISKSSLRS